MTDARVVFETCVNRLISKPETLAKAKPLYAYFHKYESQYGELSQISVLRFVLVEVGVQGFGLGQGLGLGNKPVDTSLEYDPGICHTVSLGLGRWVCTTYWLCRPWNGDTSSTLS